MSYITKETAAQMRKEIKAAFPTYKFSITVENNSTINCSLLEADIDFQFREGYNSKFRTEQVNEYHIDKNYSGKSLQVLKAINKILHKGHYDNSDSMSDYSDCSWYVHINIGKWDKPYVYKQSTK